MISISPTAKQTQCESRMLNNRFWLYTIINQQRQVQYMYLQMDLLQNLPKTRPILPCEELWIEPYPNRQFVLFNDMDHQLAAWLEVTVQNRC